MAAAVIPAVGNQEGLYEESREERPENRFGSPGAVWYKNHMDPFSQIPYRNRVSFFDSQSVGRIFSCFSIFVVV